MDVTIAKRGSKYKRTATGVAVIYNDKVLLVSSLKGPFLVLPKGGLEEGLTPEENALKECREEAGVVASIEGPAIFDEVLDYKQFGDFKAKKQREIYFLARWEDALDDWEEAGLRTVDWYDVKDPTLKDKMAPIQYAIVRKAYDLSEAARQFPVRTSHRA
ncbi:nudix hydrolase protein [Pseudomonas phage phiPMW]|uniref:Nudix hydrolase protein n=1 Tax=Pseudomonas phage phiPMW TaxID=1815582 RepID=A0A1S5R1B7_9CAUD|nr:nudix hydrolase [Pseudomonas phage phiPMW]ANA49212.1 nudix hydrolase protein [Pseudomonas phage phiPMW]